MRRQRSRKDMYPQKYRFFDKAVGCVLLFLLAFLLGMAIAKYTPAWDWLYHALR